MMKSTCTLVLLGLLMAMVIMIIGKVQVKEITSEQCSNPLTEDQCRKVAEEKGKTFYKIQSTLYPQDCYHDVYDHRYYFNSIRSKFPAYFLQCSKTLKCVCNKKAKGKYRCNGINNGCCTQAKPCAEGDGDCDNYKECAKGLTCGVNNCEWGGYDDCCVKPDCSRCQFPFTYDGQTYHQCKASSIKGKSWCSIKTTSSGQHVSGHWEYCPDGDRCEDCSRCQFPFTYAGQTYHQCKASSVKGKSWCSAKTTSSGQHVSGQWEYCPDGDKCQGANRTLTISEDKPKKLSCAPHQAIHIYAATYGAPSHNCSARTAFVPLVHLVQMECKGKKECEVKASKFVQQDPCPGMKKYFKVVYTCLYLR